MRDDMAHIPDEDLLQFADGELTEARAAGVRAHVAACWTCRARRGELESTIAAFVQGHHRAADIRITSDEGPRAHLKAHLAPLAESTRGSRWIRLRDAALAHVRFPRAQLARGLALTILLTSSLLFPPALPWGSSKDEFHAYASPHVGLTPGSTVMQSRETVCGEWQEVEAPVVSRPVALAIFKRYGITDPRPYAYELDYLIAPELGGSTDARNLWPQSYSGAWNARVKDALEERLRSLVCAGQVDLETAQRDIAADWIAAYKKYFDTDAPLHTHRTYLKDRPWP